MNSEVKSAGRILDLLDYLSQRRDPVTLSQITRDLGFPKSSAHGLLQTLTARGHLEQDSGGRYVLIESSHGFPFRLHEEPIVAIARPHMERLRDMSGETVLLSSMNAHCDIRRLAKCVSHQHVRYDVNMDAAITPYCTATGRILLAHSSADVLESYLARVQFLTYTGYTVTDPAAFRRLLIKVRQDGYALNDQEFITGSTGIAAPIWNGDGHVIAALNLGTLTSRFVERRELLILSVRSVAHDISRALGYRA
ncbi:IclR family transcriptional regulator [Tianweitania sp. BSSL-BM11]|uniref:IclR family transcriptional regulator n=1 Tax=Tianweitania aestuarii TaxID=2814886 RepID=A0ABS5RRJ2_9HYPH|nr:IclR family transcriptional regulator [Tianweitania aestuarii]MBS9719679.1 IclR family transcriptional regulator [Tianweitania aestuarii]